jgi:hypothetical protein
MWRYTTLSKTVLHDIPQHYHKIVIKLYSKENGEISYSSEIILKQVQ